MHGQLVQPFLCFLYYNAATMYYKKISKRNLAHVGMVQCMNALADKVHKQEVPCTQ